MKSIKYAFVPFLLFAAVILVYGPYIHSLPFWDDMYFFADPRKTVDGVLQGSWLSGRWVFYRQMATTWLYFGSDPIFYRIPSLLLHALTATAIYALARELLHDAGKKADLVLPGAAALAFALHPVAAFAAGVIIQRSIVLATLFSLLMWIATVRGVRTGRAGWLLASIVFYYAAVFSKEHAIMAAGVAAMLAWAVRPDWTFRRYFKSLAWTLAGWLLVALLIILVSRQVIGQNYEPIFDDPSIPLNVGDRATLFLRSAVNQGYLWFKYVLYWLLPLETWMAVDLREPFPGHVLEMPFILGAVAYLMYPLGILGGWWKGLYGRIPAVLLLSPWLLFFPHLSAVHFQESFVLYRSYLWAAALSPLFVFAFYSFPRKTVIALMVPITIFLAFSTWSRLQTFSLPVLVAMENAERLDGRDDLPMAYRSYRNRGLHIANVGFHESALKDYDRAIALAPDFSFTYHDRAMSRVALGDYDGAMADFTRAIELRPQEPKPYAGRAELRLRLKQFDAALDDIRQACLRGLRCETVKLYEEKAAAARH